MPTIGEEIAELKALGIYDDYKAELQKGNIIAMSTFKNNVQTAKAAAKPKKKKAAVKKSTGKGKQGKKK